ncbi:tetratricopeptide repeat protein [Stackebrandtia nassauensis]|uniref:Thioredoxin domain protein n=1 Tax=Stackebrandtia nassauensis (strain DSM 44728 / CIP 108903 / NRRL B-16338 / NBRC 102104 / LLR-40K-21) TaxID=446470 RepID=D3PZE7_STANL|nr:tetratricopeptide repeat protein [Stackebrandtia nassauensis]ADD41621.1 Thioredoxin domain protein [Stackebrandtia nassauensis DSM 44728]
MNTPEPSQAPQRLLAGAVDLSSLAAPRPAPPRPTDGEAPAAANGAAVIDVTEATFQAEVLERSLSVPVVIDFWADWCQPCKQLSPVLEKLAVESGGAWTLAKIDVDANPQLQAAFQVQSIPMVIAMWQGRPVDGFQGVQPETTLRQWIGRLIEATGGEAPEVPADPQLVAAESALDAGDLTGAENAFTSYLDLHPGDAAAESGLAQVRLLRRVEAAGPAAQEAAVTNPTDIPQALLASDIQVINGQAENAYRQLIDLIARLNGEDRDTVRKHLLDLFTIAGPEDPVVAQARRKLAAVLF